MPENPYTTRVWAEKKFWESGIVEGGGADN
jgi:hypothetical protein